MDSAKPKVCLKGHYSDDPQDLNPRGLAYVPLLSQELVGIENVEWLMSPAEQIGMIYLLEKLRPEIAIEIGTRFGGSLQVLARLCKKVYSLDIDPEVPNRLGSLYPNVEYIIGSSLETVPLLVDRLNRSETPVSFVLVDGDHSVKGVQADIENVLKLRPLTPLFIVMHDSLNQYCREGMRAIDWNAFPYVHAVDLDFISGTVFPRGDLWGGLALAVVLPEKRTQPLKIAGRADRAYDALLPLHKRVLFKNRITQGLAYYLTKFGFGKRSK